MDRLEGITTTDLIDSVTKKINNAIERVNMLRPPVAESAIDDLIKVLELHQLSMDALHSRVCSHHEEIERLMGWVGQLDSRTNHLIQAKPDE